MNIVTTLGCCDCADVVRLPVNTTDTFWKHLQQNGAIKKPALSFHRIILPGQKILFTKRFIQRFGPVLYVKFFVYVMYVLAHGVGGNGQLF